MTPTSKKRSADLPEIERPSTRRCLEDSPSFGSEFLKIRVGENTSSAQTFSLHRDVAIKFSDFFAAASRNGWQETVDGVIKLPEDSPEIFKIFEDFAYTGCIYSRTADDHYKTSDGKSGYRELGRIWAAWILGEKLQASHFKDAIVDALIEKMRSEQIFPTLAFPNIYAASLGRSPMKDLLVDIAIWDWRKKHLDDAIENNEGHTFLADLATKQAILLKEGKPPIAPYKQGSTCKYHEHGDEKPCYKAMFK